MGSVYSDICYHRFAVDIGGQRFQIPETFDDEELEQTVDLVRYLPLRMYVKHSYDPNKVVMNFENLVVPVKELFGAVPEQPMKVIDKERQRTLLVIRKYQDFVVASNHIDIGVFFRIDGISSTLQTDLEVHPIDLKEAAQYISKYHRHCGPPKFHKFSICLRVKGEAEPVGVAVVSTPKARSLMDGYTLEINRVCADPRYSNACSKLYGQAIRAGRAMGYHRFVSYTQKRWMLIID